MKLEKKGTQKQISIGQKGLVTDQRLQKYRNPLQKFKFCKMYVAKSKTFHDKCGAMVADVFLKVKDCFEFNAKFEILHKRTQSIKTQKESKNTTKICF